MRKGLGDFNNFYENSNYLIMYEGNRYIIHPKGSSFRPMVGQVPSGGRILAIYGNSYISSLDKVFLIYEDKDGKTHLMGL